jgi:4-amino-4-deoxy-L-arabinose transferase-like glycosyltransferase
MNAVLFTLLFAVMATGLGWSALLRVDRGARLNAGERLVLSFFIGWLVVYYGVFAIGPFRLDSLSMGMLAGILSLASLAGLTRMTWYAFGSAIAGEFRAARSDRWLAALWISVIVVSLSSLLQGLAPPNDYDSLMYHLTLPQYDIENGKITIFWDRGAFVLFPALGGHLTRFALALSGDGAAQMLHGLLGLSAGIGAALLSLRLGWGKHTALIACLMFVSIHSVIWQMATVETDTPLAAFVIFAVIVYLAWRPHRESGLAVLFGLMIGMAILIKYHGFVVAVAFVPLIAFDLFRRHGHSLMGGLIGPAVSLAVVLPHLVRNYVFSHNPVFPLHNKLFNPDQPQFWDHTISQFGTGRGFLDVLTTPWTMFVLPMHYFDGMMLGAPYLLAFAPLVLLDKSAVRRFLPMLSLIPVYYLMWFFLMPQQVRFLLPLMPLLAVIAAAGVTIAWRQAAGETVIKSGLIGVVAILALNQGLFVAVYAGIRLPPALGLMSPLAFHEKTPTMTGAFYKTCQYIRDNLKPGERYFSLIKPHSYYCPQVAATVGYFEGETDWWRFGTTKPTMSFEEFLAKMEKQRFRYLIIQKSFENRSSNKTAKASVVPIDLASWRFGDYLGPALSNMRPVIEGPFTSVYDGHDLLERLRRR